METVTDAARGVTKSDDCSETEVVADFISPAAQRAIEAARILIGMESVALDGKVLELDHTARRMGEELHWRL